MSRKDRRQPQSQTQRKQSNTGYEVGYGRPPRQHQFKSGQSGNPRGRPKGSKSEAVVLRNLLNKTIKVREAGRSKQLSILEAILIRVAEEALKGDPKAAAFLLNRYATTVITEQESNQLDENDEQILTAFAEELLARRKSDDE
jgi:hypothetical protein